MLFLKQKLNLISNEKLYRIKNSSPNKTIIIYDLKMLNKINKISFPFEIMSMSNDEQLFVFAAKTKFSFSNVENIQNCANTEQFDAAHEIKKIIISKSRCLLATKCDIFIKIWDITNLQNPRIRFSLLGKSQFEQFTFDSLYFCRQMEKQLIIINIDQFPQKEIILKPLCNDYIKGTIKAKTIDNKEIIICVSQDQLYYKQTDDANGLEILIDFNPHLSIFVYSEVSYFLAYITFFKQNTEVHKNIYIKSLENLQIADLIENAHDYGVRSLFFSSDGMLLLSGGEDYSIKIWCIKSLNLVASMHNLNDIAIELAFCPDGFYFASGTRGGSINLFIFNNSNKQYNKKQQSLLKHFENNKIGCVKVFSQEPLLQMSKCVQENLQTGPKDQALIKLIDQKQ